MACLELKEEFHWKETPGPPEEWKKEQKMEEGEGEIAKIHEYTNMLWHLIDYVKYLLLASPLSETNY